MGLAAMMTALGVLTILNIHKLGEVTVPHYDDDAAAAAAEATAAANAKEETYLVSEPFLAVYMILFAVLLFLYELMYWSPLEALNANIRKNFGFLYGLRGKGLYLIFVGCLCFGLGMDATVTVLNYATGICWFLGGIGHIFLYCTNPELAAEYSPPGGKAFGTPPADENVV